MSSFKSDGGIVSTSEENMVFLTSFFEGSIFSKTHINIETDWNKIYSPFKYGNGLMKFNYPGVPELIGHAGASGSFAYYVPSMDMYVAGTVNQIDKPQLTYKLLAKLLATLK